MSLSVRRSLMLAVPLLMLFVSTAGAVTGTIRTRVPADATQRADTLSVGVPGYVTVTIGLDTPDSIDAVVLAFLMNFNPGTSSGIERVTVDDWEWFGAYKNFALRGFDSAHQDGNTPDSGLMYAILFDGAAAYSTDTLVARFWLTPTDEGTLSFDTVTLIDGLAENITQLELRNAGPIDVSNDLSFDFQPITIVAEQPCLVDLTGDVTGDGSISASDIIFIVNYVFKSGTAPLPCTAVADATCDGGVAASDIIWLVNFVFKGGPSPCDVCELIPGTWSCP